MTPDCCLAPSPGQSGDGTMRKLLLSGLGVMTASTAGAVGHASEAPECFDAQVSAEAVRQTPMIAGDCGMDCIVVSWPWAIDLDVARVLRGSAPTGRLTVLAVQHTYRRQGRAQWWLRRNDLGAFNILAVSAEDALPLCGKGEPPAAAYIHPPQGKTLQDLVTEGEAHYGRRP